jgi:hypothetical protein
MMINNFIKENIWYHSNSHSHTINDNKLSDIEIKRLDWITWVLGNFESGKINQEGNEAIGHRVYEIQQS